MSLAMELAKTILHAEEISRNTSKLHEISPKTKNNVYKTFELDLSIPHDAYTVLKPTYMKEITHIKLFPAQSTYYYRINHGDWIEVSPGATVEETDFVVESLHIKNRAGVGVLGIYIEGKRCH